jgi:hypothetical protein
MIKRLIIQKPKLLYKILFLLLFLSKNSIGETITCGLKQVVIQGNAITKITHEDGTVHTGGSVSNNWSYDGKSIKHRLLEDKIPCGGKPKSREETIAAIAESMFENPKASGMSNQEAEQMKAYAINLMKSDNGCYLMVDAAKSVYKKGMFYIDCNDQSSNTKRIWVSEDQLKQGIMQSAMSPVSDRVAIEICNNQLKMRTNNPSTYDPYLLTGTTSRKIESSGRNVVEIVFKAANAFGLESQLVGKCILEGGTPIEVTISEQ